MENLKIKVDGPIVARMAQELLELLGYRKGLCEDCAEYVITAKHGTDYHSSGAQKKYWNLENCRLVTIPQLKDMVVLHRNDVSDANMFDLVFPNSKLFLSTDNTLYSFKKEKWSLSNLNGASPVIRRLKPITKETTMQKEYLQKFADGTYKLIVLDSVIDGHEGLIEVPEGADTYLELNKRNLAFYKDNFKYCYLSDTVGWVKTDGCLDAFMHFKALWKRHTEPEDLPFVDDAVDINTAVGYDLDNLGKQLGYRDRLPWENDDNYRFHIITFESLKKSKELGVASDTQVGGTHYKDMAIQPVEFALANKLDFCQGNVVKYVLRHADKNGKEDLEKAKHYIDLMIQHYYS